MNAGLVVRQQIIDEVGLLVIEDFVLREDVQPRYNIEITIEGFLNIQCFLHGETNSSGIKTKKYLPCRSPLESFLNA